MKIPNIEFILLSEQPHHFYVVHFSLAEPSDLWSSTVLCNFFVTSGYIQNTCVKYKYSKFVQYRLQNLNMKLYGHEWLEFTGKYVLLELFVMLTNKNAQTS